MGRFSTTLHIKNNVNREEFTKSFNKAMKKRGFLPCSEDKAAVSYFVGFGSGWVSLSNEDYSGNPNKVKTDVLELSKELKTAVISVEVVDSDFAILTFNGDTVIVGDGSGYGFEDAPKGDRKLWEPLFADGKTWEEFSESVNENEVFVEDVLWDVAKVLGIEPRYICSDHRDFSEEDDKDENITAFYFKKADAKDKPMSLNDAFKKVFGEALAPLGYQPIKGKYPYLVRVIPGGEIIHVITCEESLCSYPPHRKFDIVGGIATVYRYRIDLDYSSKHNNTWLNPIGSFYARTVEKSEYDQKTCESLDGIKYNENDNSSLFNAMNKALECANKHMLPYLNCAVDLKSSLNCIKVLRQKCSTNNFSYLLNFEGCGNHDEGFLYIKADAETLKTGKNKFFTDPEVLAELDRRKAANTEILHSYGLFDEPAIKLTPKQEPQKPMTLNAAFIKVFGEGLTPFGFKKVNSKQPYFARVIDGEIIQLVSIAKKKHAKIIGGKTFEILCGIATVYRGEIDFNVKPENSWLKNISKIYSGYHPYDRDIEYISKIGGFNYNTPIIDQETFEKSFSASELTDSLNRALDEVKKTVLPIFDGINDLMSCKKYFDFIGWSTYPNLNFVGEGLLDAKVFSSAEEFYQHTLSNSMREMKIRESECREKGVDPSSVLKEFENMKEGLESSCFSLFNNPEFQAKAPAELDRRKAANIEKLRSYGLFDEPANKLAPKQEPQKPMTLNAAFNKVFGEGLEPLGFKRLKKIKNKQPFYVRVVNGEILHVVTYRTLSSHKPKYKRVEILGGAVTVYRGNLDFLYYTLNPMLELPEISKLFCNYPGIEVNEDLMKSVVRTNYVVTSGEKDILNEHPWLGTNEEFMKNTNDKIMELTAPENLRKSFDNSIMSFFVNSENSEEMLAELDEAFNVLKNITLKILDNVTDLDQCIDYFSRTGFRLDLCPFDEFITSADYGSQEGLILVKNNYKGSGIEKMERDLAVWFKYRNDLTQQEMDQERKERDARRLEQIALRDEMIDDPELNKRALEECERRKAANIERLKEFGLEF